MRENADQNNSKYGHFSRSDSVQDFGGMSKTTHWMIQALLNWLHPTQTLNI